jgi:hypothetical protein
LLPFSFGDSFFEKPYIPTHPLTIMPSHRTVALSLDEETQAMWQALPIGERSKRVREALRIATIVNDRDCLVEALRRALDQCTKQNKDLRLYGVRIEKGDKLVLPLREDLK